MNGTVQRSAISIDVFLATLLTKNRVRTYSDTSSERKGNNATFPLFTGGSSNHFVMMPQAVALRLEQLD
jgi:hypothetical protein